MSSLRICCLLSLASLFAVPLPGQTEPLLELGKRGSFYRLPVTSANVGSWRSSGRLLFRTSPDESWRPTGFFAKNLRPHLSADPETQHQFERYRRTELASTGCLVGLGVTSAFTVITGLFWGLSSLGEPGGGDQQLGRAFFAWLGGRFAFGLGRALLHQQSERRLQSTVQQSNGLSAIPESRSGWTLSIRPCAARNSIGLGVVVQQR